MTNGYCQPYQGGYGGYPGGGSGGGASAPAYACSGAQNDYEAEDGGTGPGRTKQEVQADDLEALLAGIPSAVRITRTHASLAHASLDRDLVLSASADQGLLAPARTVTREKNQPTCTIYKGCDAVGTAPRDEAIARSDTSGGSNESFSCAVTAPSQRRSSVLTLVGLAALALVLSKRLRRK